MAIDAMTARRAGIAFATTIAALLAACATPPPAPDLATFLERRATCDHFRGEVPDPPDPQRMREVMQGIADYCTGSDAQLAALKQRWRDDPAVVKQLERFEPKIESK
jgi:hypothetical protein